MKQSLTLQETLAELERQETTKRDFKAPTNKLAVIPVLTENGGASRFDLEIDNVGMFPILSNAHQQIATHCGIPKIYYDRMMTEAPGLLRDNIQTWFDKSPEVRLVRTLDTKMRAFLSSRYRIRDSFDLARTAVPILLEDRENLFVESCAITERSLYIKAVTRRLTAEVSVGDVVQSGIIISNSEIGAASLKVEPMIYTLACKNGMILPASSMKKYHVGRNSKDFTNAFEVLRDETIEADDRAFWMAVADVIRASFDEIQFNKAVDKMRETAGQKIEANPIEVIEVVQKRFGLTNDEKNGVLTSLLKENDLTQYGLLNAVTRAAQDVADYDRATELERLGGVVLELSPKDWKLISTASAA